MHNDRVKEAITLEVWEKNKLKLQTTTHTLFGIWQSLLQEHLNTIKYTWENWLKQILKNYIKLFKRKQITTKPEDCLWEWRMGKIWICAMLTILPLYSAWLCYNCVYTRGVMLLELNLLNLLLSYLILGILWLSAML